MRTPGREHRQTLTSVDGQKTGLLLFYHCLLHPATDGTKRFCFLSSQRVRVNQTQGRERNMCWVLKPVRTLLTEITTTFSRFRFRSYRLPHIYHFFFFFFFFFFEQMDQSS